MLFAFSRPMIFDFLLEFLRVLFEGAPDASLSRNRGGAGWDRPLGGDGCQLAGAGSPAAKVRGASGRGLLGRDSRQRGVLALGLVVASGKPNASAQAVVRCTQAGCSYSHVLRESGAACR